jgi:hypothetical protein
MLSHWSPGAGGLRREAGNHGICEGPLFRPVAKGGRLGAERLADKSVFNLVKAYATRIGLDPAAFGSAAAS